ncbi:uncharacterized protein LOC144620793 [Crassostrea virginica]
MKSHTANRLPVSQGVWHDEDPSVPKSFMISIDVVAIRRDPGPLFKISEHTVVCSRHFKTSDYKWTPVRKTLKPGSVPSVFNWTIVTTPRRDIPKHQIPGKRARRDNAVGTNQIEEVDDHDMGVLSRISNDEG